MSARTRGLRDLFFLLAGSAIAYHEFWLEEDPSPIGAFMVLFLWGLIPAFRAEDANVPSPMELLIRLLSAGRGTGAEGNPGNPGREGRAGPEGRAELEEEREDKAGPEDEEAQSRPAKPSRRPSKRQA